MYLNTKAKYYTSGFIWTRQNNLLYNGRNTIKIQKYQKIHY